jgi:hypothetical protein
MRKGVCGCVQRGQNRMAWGLVPLLVCFSLNGELTLFHGRQYHVHN